MVDVNTETMIWVILIENCVRSMCKQDVSVPEGIQVDAGQTLSEKIQKHGNWIIQRFKHFEFTNLHILMMEIVLACKDIKVIRSFL